MDRYGRALEEDSDSDGSTDSYADDFDVPDSGSSRSGTGASDGDVADETTAPPQVVSAGVSRGEGAGNSASDSNGDDDDDGGDNRSDSGSGDNTEQSTPRHATTRLEHQAVSLPSQGQLSSDGELSSAMRVSPMDLRMSASTQSTRSNDANSQRSRYDNGAFFRGNLVDVLLWWQPAPCVCVALLSLCASHIDASRWCVDPFIIGR